MSSITFQIVEMICRFKWRTQRRHSRTERCLENCVLGSGRSVQQTNNVKSFPHCYLPAISSLHKLPDQWYHASNVGLFDTLHCNDLLLKSMKKESNLSQLSNCGIGSQNRQHHRCCPFLKATKKVDHSYWTTWTTGISGWGWGSGHSLKTQATPPNTTWPNQGESSIDWLILVKICF